MKNETTLDDVKEICDKFAQKSVKYMVVGGYAIDGHRGRITRYHDDIDILCLERDNKVVMACIKEIGYDLIKDYGDFYLFKKNKNGKKPSKLHLSLLREDKKLAVSNGRIAVTKFPQSWFDKAPIAEINGVKFRIVTNELLKKFGLDAQKGDDATYARSIVVDNNLYEQVARVLKK